MLSMFILKQVAKMIKPKENDEADDALIKALEKNRTTSQMALGQLSPIKQSETEEDDDTADDSNFADSIKNALTEMSAKKSKKREKPNLFYIDNRGVHNESQSPNKNSIKGKAEEDSAKNNEDLIEQINKAFISNNQPTDDNYSENEQAIESIQNAYIEKEKKDKIKSKAERKGILNHLGKLQSGIHSTVESLGNMGNSMKQSIEKKLKHNPITKLHESLVDLAREIGVDVGFFTTLFKNLFNILMNTTLAPKIQWIMDKLKSIGGFVFKGLSKLGSIIGGAFSFPNGFLYRMGSYVRGLFDKQFFYDHNKKVITYKTNLAAGEQENLDEDIRDNYRQQAKDWLKEVETRISKGNVKERKEVLKDQDLVEYLNQKAKELIDERYNTSLYEKELITGKKKGLTDVGLRVAMESYEDLKRQLEELGDGGSSEEREQINKKLDQIKAILDASSSERKAKVSLIDRDSMRGGRAITGGTGKDFIIPDMAVRISQVDNEYTRAYQNDLVERGLARNTKKYANDLKEWQSVFQHYNVVWKKDSDGNETSQLDKVFVDSVNTNQFADFVKSEFERYEDLLTSDNLVANRAGYIEFNPDKVKPSDIYISGMEDWFQNANEITDEQLQRFNNMGYSSPDSFDPQSTMSMKEWLRHAGIQVKDGYFDEYLQIVLNRLPYSYRNAKHLSYENLSDLYRIYPEFRDRFSNLFINPEYQARFINLEKELLRLKSANITGQQLQTAFDYEGLYSVNNIDSSGNVIDERNRDFGVGVTKGTAVSYHVKKAENRLNTMPLNITGITGGESFDNAKYQELLTRLPELERQAADRQQTGTEEYFEELKTLIQQAGFNPNYYYIMPHSANNYVIQPDADIDGGSRPSGEL